MLGHRAEKETLVAERAYQGVRRKERGGRRRKDGQGQLAAETAALAAKRGRRREEGREKAQRRAGRSHARVQACRSGGGHCHAQRCHGLIRQRGKPDQSHLGLCDVSQVRPSNNPSPATAEEGCTCQMRLSARMRPSFS